MIVAKMDLKSAISADRDDNLCTVVITNDGTASGSKGNYDVKLFARSNGRLVRTARVENWSRNSHPAWRLLAAAMKALEGEQ